MALGYPPTTDYLPIDLLPPPKKCHKKTSVVLTESRLKYMEWGKVSVRWKIIYLTEEDDIASGYDGHEDKITPRYVF